MQRFSKRLRERLAQRDDSGITLVEAIVSLVLIGIVMSSLAVAMIGSVRASMVARQNQQAGDILNRTVEQVRSLSYSAIAMVATDIVGTDGGLLSTCGAGTCLDLGGGASEPLLLAVGGSVNPHISTLTLNRVPYRVSRYVTSATDTEAGASFKRLTVNVSWTVNGQTKTRTASTFVSDTRRGLPLPLFKVTPVGSTTTSVNPGAQVRFGMKVTNNGARDTWNLSNDALPTAGWTYVFDNGDNTFDAATDTVAVTDTTADGALDTGPIEPTKSVVVWMSRTVPGTPAGPYADVVRFTATSFAEPTFNSSFVTTTNVMTGVVASPTPSPAATVPTGCPAQVSPPVASGVGSLFPVYLHNDAALNDGPSNALSPLTLAKDTGPTSTSLNDFSLNDGTVTGMIQAGRMLRPSALGTSETDALKKAQFRWRNEARYTINGTVTLELWLVPQAGQTTDPVDLTFSLRTSSNGTTFTDRASYRLQQTEWGCATFNKVTIAFPAVDFIQPKNDYFDLWVSNTGTNDVRLGYGATGQAARLVVPLS